MGNCYIENIVTNQETVCDIKQLVPDAGTRRRMSRVLKNAVSTAVTCCGGLEVVASQDAILTATGLGCLTDSVRFLENVVRDNETLLNPTPFIQSTFNTVGGILAVLTGNRTYNVTYVNGTHSFEDALLDGYLQILEGESRNILVGAFDENTPAQHRIMERMGAFRHGMDCEGSVFCRLVSEPSERTIARITGIYFTGPLTPMEVRERYVKSSESQLLYHTGEKGLFMTASALALRDAVDVLLSRKVREVVVYNCLWNRKATIVTLECI